MSEVDLDTIFGQEVWAAPSSPPRLDPEPKAFDPKEDLREKPESLLMALVFGSASKGRGHVVTITLFADGSRGVMCICPAGLSIGKRPKGCWAMVWTRTLLGIPQPEET